MMTANSHEEIDAKIWFCNKCQISNMAQLFLFGLENNYDLWLLLRKISPRLILNQKHIV